jgi:LysM repeat protein
LAPVALAAVVGAIVMVVMIAPASSGPQRRPAHSPTMPVLHLPPYLTVRPGDTFTKIAQRTSLTIAQLETFNPGIDPMGLVAGQRLNLWLHPPAPRPRRLGPRFSTVRAGESFGSIAAKTGINLATLEQLNPRLKPSTLQPGDLATLRR